MPEVTKINCLQAT